MYTTLTQVKSYIGKDAAATTDDNRLIGFILAAENTINSVRVCSPRRQTRLFDYPIKKSEPFGVYSAAERFATQMNAALAITSGKLTLDADLLELEKVLNGDASEITTDLVTEPANLYPKHNLRLVTPGIYWTPGQSGQREQVISVTGVWGWHPDYSNAWQIVDALTEAVNASATVFKVADADGPDENGMTPRFQAGQILSLHTEYVVCVAVDTALNTITVRRGQNGTVAAAHDLGDAISVYRPPAQIVQCATRIAVWLYRQKDANVFDKTTILNTGVAITPSALPTDARAMLPPARLSL